MTRQKTLPLQAAKKPSRRFPRLWLEALEDRTLPSGTVQGVLPNGIIGPIPPQTIIPGYNNLEQNHPTAELAPQPPLLPRLVPPRTIAGGAGQPPGGTNLNTRTLVGSTQAMAPGLHNYPPPLGVTVIGNVIVNNPASDGIRSNFTQSTTTNLVFGNTIVV